MKHFDILVYVYFTILIFVYYKGYLAFTSGHMEMAGAYAVCSGISMVAFLRRVRYLNFLHMRFKKIDKLSGRAFEQYLTAQFKHLGYRVELTEFSHDYGADLVLKKRGKRIVVQAKRYESNVGIAAVQEAVGAIAYYGADRAMVVTNSGFTKSARNLAKENDVELWGRAEIRQKFSIAE